MKIVKYFFGMAPWSCLRAYEVDGFVQNNGQSCKDGSSECLLSFQTNI